MGQYVSTLAHKIYIRWWDRFAASISLVSLPPLPKKDKAIITEAVIVSSFSQTPKIYPAFESESTQYSPQVYSRTQSDYESSSSDRASSYISPSVVYPLALPPNVYLFYLQIKHQNPQMNENEVIQRAYMMDFDFNNTQTKAPLTPKVEIPESPLPLTQQEIHEVLTVLNTPSPSYIAGYGQPSQNTQDLFCSNCQIHGHIKEACSKIIPTICYNCGDSGHTVKQCRFRENSPTTFDTPLKEMKSAQSETSPITTTSAHTSA